MTKGGYREGSGRKAFCENITSVHWRVSESAKSWIKNKAVEDGVSIGVIIDELIKFFESKQCTVKVADNAIPMDQLCTKLQQDIIKRGLIEPMRAHAVTYASPEALMEIEKLRICYQFKRPARINNKVVQITDFAIETRSGSPSKISVSFEAFPIKNCFEELVFEIDVNKIK